MAVDAALLALEIRRLAELDEAVLAGKALPALDPDPRRVDAARGKRGRAGRRKRSGRGRGAHAGRIAGLAADQTAHVLAGAISAGAIDGAAKAQVRGHRDRLG